MVIIVAGVLWISKKAKTVKSPVSSPTPSIEQQIETKFKGLVIPDDSEKIELKDVSGGSGIGIATKSEILADLPDLANGKFYQVWLSKDSKNILLGHLTKAKGGYLLNYDLTKFPGYNKVIVTSGSTHILEGSF